MIVSLATWLHVPYKHWNYATFFLYLYLLKKVDVNCPNGLILRFISVPQISKSNSLAKANIFSESPKILRKCSICNKFFNSRRSVPFLPSIRWYESAPIAILYFIQSLHSTKHFSLFSIIGLSTIPPFGFTC